MRTSPSAYEILHCGQSLHKPNIYPPTIPTTFLDDWSTSKNEQSISKSFIYLSY